ncbi:hypothetical protein BT93_H3174 [Corymbia citriodora subsp. variegata]|nr:hypothetical protein BT93_H3174 [Corymbia citriodora subsp. variegata]
MHGLHLSDRKLIEAEVEQWVTRVQTVSDKTHDELEHDGRAKKDCFCGWLPNLKEHYRLGREARRTVLDIQALISKSHFPKVYYENAPPGYVTGTSDVNTSAGDQGNNIFESRASFLEKIMDALNDEKFKVIGVYGHGGVGKTTLLEEVKKKSEKGLFGMIAKAKASQTQDLKKIQDDIAYAFRLNLKDEPSEEGRRDRLFQKIQSPTKAVGIPLGDESSRCKLLLTSRIEDVLKKEMCADETFHLKGLEDGKAFRLFEKTVGDRLRNDEELKAIAIQLVKKLAGLPLSIISVARTLKDSSAYAWRNASIKIDMSKVETIVKLSYDHLKSEGTKSLFLICGLIGRTIQVETLLVLGMDDTRFKDRLNVMLAKFRSACLLLDDGDDKENLTIHDLYSEVTIHYLYSEVVTSTPITVDVSRDRLDKLMTCRFADLKILMLSQTKGWYWMPEHQPDLGDCSGLLDFTFMKELRVLYFCNMHITSIPSLIRILGNLQSLYLDQCDVEDVAILVKLKALQILSFTGSTISRLPKEIGELTNLRSLNLSNCYKLEIIESSVLKSLIKLEELHMKESFDQWMGKDEMPSEFCNVTLAEFKSLRKIASLEISIPNPTILLEDADLPFENMIRFWINIGNARGREFEGLRTMMLELRGNDGILSKEWVKKILHKTQYLHLDGLREFKENAHDPSVKYIASSSNGAFSILESLFLVNLINLEKICHGHIVGESLSKLKAVTVENCKQLKYLWCLSQIPKLGRLEEIKVRECDSMRAIFTIDARKDIVLVDDRVKFPYVRRLDLVKLPNMTAFCIEAEMTSKGAPVSRINSAMVVDEEGGDEGIELVTTTSELQDTYSIPYLIESCFDLLHSFPSTIIERLCNLKSVKVNNCPSLKSLFDCGSLDSNTGQTRVLLPELGSINVQSCPSLESLFNCGSHYSNAEHKIVLLPKLEEVSVSGVERLRHVVMSDSRTVLGFPSLKTVNVENCSNLRYLFPNHTATTLGKLEKLKITKCKQTKEVIPEKEVGRSEAEVMSFPCLSELTLKELDKLIDFSSRSCSYDFASLEDLKIMGCHNFRAFIRNPTSVERQKLEIEGAQCKELWNNQIPNDSFCKLEFLELNHCANLLHIAQSHMSKRLQHCLKEVRVTSCHSIETIFEGDGVDTGSGKLRKLVLSHLDNLTHIWQCNGLSISTTITFFVFTNLKLFDLPKFRSILPQKYAERCPSLHLWSKLSCGTKSDQFPVKTIETIIKCHNLNFGCIIVSFPNLEELEIEGAQCKELWNSQIPTNSFLKLRSFELKNCDNLQSIDPSHLWRRLQHCLKVLEVESCRSIQIIYEGDETNAEGGILKRLILCDLENLRHIWQSDGLPNVPFPNLGSVHVVRCPHLKMLFTTFTTKFLEQMEVLVVESCEDMEQIAGHEISEEVIHTTITFSKLTHLGLIKLPNFRSFLPDKYSRKDFPFLKYSSVESCKAEPDQALGGFWEAPEDYRRRKRGRQKFFTLRHTSIAG